VSICGCATTGHFRVPTAPLGKGRKCARAKQTDDRNSCDPVKHTAQKHQRRAVSL